MDNSKRGHIPMQEKLDLNKSQGAQTPKEFPEVKGWLDEDLEYYHLKELHYSAQCHTQMSLWIISRGVVLLILLMEYKFQVWYIELTSPSDHSNSRKNTRTSKDNEDPGWNTSFKTRRTQKTTSAVEALWKTILRCYLYLLGTLEKTRAQVTLDVLKNLDFGYGSDLDGIAPSRSPPPTSELWCILGGILLKSVGKRLVIHLGILNTKDHSSQGNHGQGIVNVVVSILSYFCILFKDLTTGQAEGLCRFEGRTVSFINVCKPKLLRSDTLPWDLFQRTMWSLFRKLGIVHQSLIVESLSRIVEFERKHRNILLDTEELLDITLNCFNVSGSLLSP
ncbi:hypothetical protein Tco_0359897 [Tanacetum coccineum]